MKVTVLGCGSAYGVPFVGGNWGKCDPKQPRNRRLAPSIFIEDKDTKILVDLGPDYKTQAEKHSIRDFDALLYTHQHADHIAGNFHLPMMMTYFQDKNLMMYAERATRKDIEKVWWFQNDPSINVQYYGPGRPLWVEFTHYFPFKVNHLEVLPLKQQHGRIESTGFRMGNFAYSTDTNVMPDKTFDLLDGLDVWIVEADSESPTTMHSTLEQTLSWIERVKPKQAYITHLDYTMDYDTISKKLPPNVALAYDGLVIDL